MKCTWTSTSSRIDQFCEGTLAKKRARARKTCAKASSLFAQVAGHVQRLRSKMHMAYGMWIEASLFAQEIVHSKHPRLMRILFILVGRVLGLAFSITPMFPSQPFPFENPNLYRDVRSGILDYTHSSRASHHLLSQATGTGELTSSGDKAEHCSSSCTAEEDG